MPREAHLRLQALLDEKGRDTTRADLARLLDISDATLRGYLEDRWPVLDRAVLERLADFFECDVSTLLTTSESQFFDSFRASAGEEAGQTPVCVFLRRPDADAMATGRPVAFRDNRAIDHVGDLLRDNVIGIVNIESSATGIAFDVQTRNNCVIVGSPAVNPAAEMALCRAFGASPFDPTQSEKLPFQFRIRGATQPSSWVRQAGDGEKIGIWLRRENTLVEADHWPTEEFRRMKLRRGRDCGLVLVLNHRADSGSPRKLIVLAGFAGAGTEAAGLALANHYRDLEPRDGETCVWGVIEVLYSKPGNSMTRSILNPTWRYRAGGRFPISLR